MEWITVIHVVAPILTACIGLFSGFKLRKINTLNEMQKSIDVLVTENNRVLNRIVEVKNINVELQLEIANLKLENQVLKTKLEKLTTKVNNGFNKTKNGKQKEGGDL